MSYDLVFWKGAPDNLLSPGEIWESLSSGQVPEGLERFDVDVALVALELALNRPGKSGEQIA